MLCLALGFQLGIYILINSTIQNVVIRALTFAGSMLLIYFITCAFKRASAAGARGDTGTGATGGKCASADQQLSPEPHGISTSIGRSQM